MAGRQAPRSVRLPDELDAWLVAYAAANSSNPSAVIVRLLLDERDRVQAINRDKEGTTQ